MLFYCVFYVHLANSTVMALGCSWVVCLPTAIWRIKVYFFCFMLRTLTAKVIEEVNVDLPVRSYTLFMLRNTLDHTNTLHYAGRKANAKTVVK